MHKEKTILISTEEKKCLCQIARNALIQHLRPEQEVDSTSEIKSGVLQQARPLFVTLWKQGSLRGCCGIMEAKMPLVEAVAYMAISSGMRDWRFPPLEKKELDSIIIEISVLSDAVRMNSPDEIVLGHHGVWVKKGTRSGVFLPQVAIECGWNKETLLEEACIKAGLEKDVWEKGAEVYLFESIKFSERD